MLQYELLGCPLFCIIKVYLLIFNMDNNIQYRQYGRSSSNIFFVSYSEQAIFTIFENRKLLFVFCFTSYRDTCSLSIHLNALFIIKFVRAPFLWIQITVIICFTLSR